MSMDNPLVTVLIVTWNRKDDVLEAVRSVYAQSYRPVEVLVVDNGSTDGTLDALAQTYPQARSIALGENAGASAGRNAGIAAARGDIIFLLDSDASLGPDTLTSAVSKLQSEPAVGVIACKIVNAATKQLDRHAGWAFSEKDRADQDRPWRAYRFSEGGAAVRREVFERAGDFWDRLFFGREGEELSLRIWDAGYGILYWPEAIVYHRVSPLQSFSRPEKEYYDLRNSLYIGLARYPWWMLLAFLPLRLGASLVRGVRRRYLRYTVKALLDVLRHAPALLRERRPVKSSTARLYITLHREHGSLRWDLKSWLKYKA
jgi:GT2 family glycosyltransferase